MVLAPSIQPCPPANFAEHIAVLARIAFDPPEIDLMTLRGLQHAEDTLRKGSKSFDVAKLAFGREMRIGLVAIYAWCRMTVSHRKEVSFQDGALTNDDRTIWSMIPRVQPRVTRKRSNT
jgi:15-cis-phytoene synthase/lycopene beta-cyclase